MLGDAVLQLPHVGARQQVVQLRLAEQRDLDQLVPFGFEVGQQADLFQRFRRHCMRLVDQQHDLATGGEFGHQCLLHRAQQPVCAAIAAGGGCAAQLVGQHGEQFAAVHQRVGEIDGAQMGGKVIDQHPRQHGLAGTDFAADLDQPLFASERIDERVEQCPAVRAAEEEIGMRGDAER